MRLARGGAVGLRLGPGSDGPLAGWPGLGGRRAQFWSRYPRERVVMPGEAGSVRYPVRCWRAYRCRLCGFPGPGRCLAWVRKWRRSELSRAAAISVIAVTAIGAGKLRIWAASWSSAAPTAQIMIVAAA